MYWNAAYYHELPSETQRLQLAEPLNTIPMIENVPTWIGGIISVTAVLRAIAAAGDRRKRQREFWSGILSQEELKSNLVVCGGRRSAFADQVRGGIHSKGTSALIELILPLVLQTLYPLQKLAGNIMEAVSLGGADRIDNLGTLVKKAFTTGSRPPILFVEKLRCGKPRLLLPLGGHISNALVEQQLRETQRLRKFRVVVTSQDNPDEPREVTTPTQVEALRAEKKRLIAGRNDLDEFSVLDPKIRYELWSKTGPEAQPHVDSFKTSRAADSVYVLFTRLPAHSSSGEAALSVQSLHVLGLAAMSLFHSPYETLGNAAESFRKAALQSMKATNSVGFEAILKVERDQSFDPPETPRHFEGWPSLSRVKLSVQAEPTPIVW